MGHLTANHKQLDPRKKDKLEHRINERETRTVSDLGVSGGSVPGAAPAPVYATGHTTRAVSGAPLLIQGGPGSDPPGKERDFRPPRPQSGSSKDTSSRSVGNDGARGGVGLSGGAPEAADGS